MAEKTSILQKLAAKNLKLPNASKPRANYVPVLHSGNQIFVSGQISEDENGLITGRVGDTIDVERATYAAQNCALAVLSQITQSAKTPLENIRFVKLTVFINSAPDFFDQPQIANGASDLLVELLGPDGQHARSAVGAIVLPLNAAVEIDAVVELKK